jgi:hypothetical protein
MRLARGSVGWTATPVGASGPPGWLVMATWIACPRADRSRPASRGPLSSLRASGGQVDQGCYLGFLRRRRSRRRFLGFLRCRRFSTHSCAAFRACICDLRVARLESTLEPSASQRTLVEIDPRRRRDDRRASTLAQDALEALGGSQAFRHSATGTCAAPGARRLPGPPTERRRPAG